MTTILFTENLVFLSKEPSWSLAVIYMWSYCRWTHSINHLTDVSDWFIIHFKVTYSYHGYSEHTCNKFTLTVKPVSFSLILEPFIYSLDRTNCFYYIMDHMQSSLTLGYKCVLLYLPWVENLTGFKYRFTGIQFQCLQVA